MQLRNKSREITPKSNNNDIARLRSETLDVVRQDIAETKKLCLYLNSLSNTEMKAIILYVRLGYSKLTTRERK